MVDLIDRSRRVTSRRDRTGPSRSIPKSRWADGLNWPTVFWLATVHVGALAAPLAFTWTGLIAMLVLGWATGGIGICLGYHRLFTHRSFAVVRPLRWLIAVLGSLAGQGSLIDWVADHRKHHALSDREGDPHSPSDGPWWSHMLWLLSARNRSRENHRQHWAPDLLREPVLVWIDRLFLPLQLAFGTLVFVLGYWAGGPAMACSWLVWAIFLRLAYVLHVTWLVNSASHMWGYRNYPTRDNSRNLWWVALVTYGEGWHNNHHAFPRMARNRHRWWEFDPTYEIIRILGMLGLAWDIVVAKEEPRARRAVQVSRSSADVVTDDVEARPSRSSPAETRPDDDSALSVGRGGAAQLAAGGVDAVALAVSDGDREAGVFEDLGESGRGRRLWRVEGKACHGIVRDEIHQGRTPLEQGHELPGVLGLVVEVVQKDVLEGDPASGPLEVVVGRLPGPRQCRSCDWSAPQPVSQFVVGGRAARRPGDTGNRCPPGGEPPWAARPWRS